MLYCHNIRLNKKYLVFKLMYFNITECIKALPTDFSWPPVVKWLRSLTQQLGTSKRPKLARPEWVWIFTQTAPNHGLFL